MDANDVFKAPLHWGFTRYYELRARLRRSSGVAPVEESDELVVSLTSYPKRFDLLHLCVESLLSQSLRPNRVVLWISRDHLPQLPEKVTRLQAFGLEVRADSDHGPFTKIVHSLTRFPDAVIVTADDDNIYPRWWLERLVASYRQFPRAIHCHRAHAITTGADGGILPYDRWNYGAVGYDDRPSLRLVPTGVSGVLYPPRSLHHDVTNIEKYRALCSTNDDIWLKVMSMLRDTPCRLIAGRSRDFYIVRETQRTALWHSNEAGRTHAQTEAVLEHFGLRHYFSTSAAK